MRVARLAALGALVGGCTCGDGASGGDVGAVAALEAAAQAALIERVPEVERLWTDAREGDETELARLASREGSAGLVERATDPRFRSTALAAMGHALGLGALPTLGQSAKSGPESEALVAVDSAARLAANKREQGDPEEVDELRDGCAALLASATDRARPRLVRVGAVRALRMLVDRGCVKSADIPTELDVK